MADQLTITIPAALGLEALVIMTAFERANLVGESTSNNIRKAASMMKAELATQLSDEEAEMASNEGDVLFPK